MQLNRNTLCICWMLFELGTIPTLTGCGTIGSMASPNISCNCQEKVIKPRFIYSGTRCDVESIRSTCVVNLWPDVPFSFVADTAVLPIRLVQAAIYPLRRKAYITSGKAQIAVTSMGDEAMVRAGILDGTWNDVDHVTCSEVSGSHGSFSTRMHVIHPLHERRSVDLSPINAAMHAHLRVGDVISCLSE
jgi:uncharacterized protein YceK